MSFFGETFEIKYLHSLIKGSRKSFQTDATEGQFWAPQNNLLVKSSYKNHFY